MPGLPRPPYRNFETPRHATTQLFWNVCPWLALASIWAVACPVDAQTPAGGLVVNVARAETDGRSYPSNPASLRIDELLDIGLGSSATRAAVPENGVAATPFVLTNAGNGQEAFLLSGTATGGGVRVIGFAIDTNGNGAFDAGSDTAIADGAATPLLPAGSSLSLLVLTQGRVGAGDTLTVEGRAVTASGRPGTTVAGAGDGGGNAVVGLTSAMAAITFPLVAASIDPVPDATLTKSQSVIAPGGGAEPVAGATLTYTLDATFAGAGVARNARLDDPLPSGTAYVPGSLRLDGATLSDASDGDAGSFDGSTVRAALGDVAAPAAHSLSFQVIIK